MSIPESKFNIHRYLTVEGLEKLKKEFDERKQLRQEIAKRIEFARGQGDISENSEYDTAKNEQGENESRLIEIEDILGRAEIISKKEKSASIQFCSSVSLKKEGSDEIEKYLLVGAEEADPLSGKISHESPLGQTLLGKKKGDIIKVFTPKGKINYNIIDVG